MGRIPGLVVTGVDLCVRGCGFESRHHILDGHFSHLFVVKIVLFVWKDENEAGNGPFLKKVGFNLAFSLGYSHLLLTEIIAPEKDINGRKLWSSG